jgi:hypothetical protein
MRRGHQHRCLLLADGEHGASITRAGGRGVAGARARHRHRHGLQLALQPARQVRGLSSPGLSASPHRHFAPHGLCQLAVQPAARPQRGLRAARGQDLPGLHLRHLLRLVRGVARSFGCCCCCCWRFRVCVCVCVVRCTTKHHKHRHTHTQHTHTHTHTVARTVARTASGTCHII